MCVYVKCGPTYDLVEELKKKKKRRRRQNPRLVHLITVMLDLEMWDVVLQGERGKPRRPLCSLTLEIH
ncbi:hypothetical protein F7725_015254 [Dissostichus mawsoni]|uniref:Uncharacterized protein n=1 Tax=Dissostichus mawsoni TaxID=36200 RepID=A0A7J5YJU5_DISMA|nr:hypothetical protein F7725_015254 [Dissostichus mawsoni]